jgi:hypothetical protein
MVPAVARTLVLLGSLNTSITSFGILAIISPPIVPPYFFLELAFKVILPLAILESQRIFRRSKFPRRSLGLREIAYFLIYQKVIGISHEQ